MSFWDNVKKFAQPYTDEEYDEFEEGGEDFNEELEPTPRSGRRGSDKAEATAENAENAAENGRFNGKVLNMNGNKQSVILFRPNSFDDACKAADDLRDKKIVIVNLESVDKGMARRVVDFLSGCSYALDGKARKIAQSTYLFAPHSMDVAGDLEGIQAEAEAYI